VQGCLHGTLSCSAPLTAPLSGKKCAAYALQVQWESKYLPYLTVGAVSKGTSVCPQLFALLNCLPVSTNTVSEGGLSLKLPGDGNSFPGGEVVLDAANPHLLMHDGHLDTSSQHLAGLRAAQLDDIDTPDVLEGIGTYCSPSTVCLSHLLFALNCSPSTNTSPTGDREEGMRSEGLGVATSDVEL
jgi:hypothetical protein